MEPLKQTLRLVAGGVADRLNTLWFARSLVFSLMFDTGKTFAPLTASHLAVNDFLLSHLNLRRDLVIAGCAFGRSATLFLCLQLALAVGGANY